MQSIFNTFTRFQSNNEILNARINILGSTRREKNNLMKRLQKKQNVKDFEIKLKSASGKAISVISNYIATNNEKGMLIMIKGTVALKKRKIKSKNVE